MYARTRTRSWMLRIGRRFCNSPVGERVASLKNKKIRGGSRRFSVRGHSRSRPLRVEAKPRVDRRLDDDRRGCPPKKRRDAARRERNQHARPGRHALRGKRALSGRAYRARTTYRVTTWRARVATTKERTGKRENMARTERREKGLNTPRRGLTYVLVPRP